ncbi:MAG: universal stress protein [Desulfobacteraceae bacterium]|nr:universal stress protein [Desulfobacteraceae bacterium]
MWKLLSKLQKNLVWAIPISMLIGLVYGYLFNAAPLKQFIIPITFIMIYPMMVTLNINHIFKGKDLKLQTTTQVINFIIVPVIVLLIGKLLLNGPDEKFGLWAVGLFLIGVLPTSGMTISWTGFAKGNKEAAIKMVVFGLIIGALAAPIYTKIFMGTTIEVNMLHMFKQIAIFVFLPLFAGLLTQYLGIKKWGQKQWNQRVKPKFPPFSALGVILIAFLAMSLKAKNIIANPGDIISILIPLVLFYFISYFFLTILGKLVFKREDAIAMVFGVVMRDLSIALAIAMTAFGKQGMTIALLISLAYIIQIQSAAWYVKFADFFFGPATKDSLVAPVIEKMEDTSIQKLQEPQESQESMVIDISKILFATDLSQTARHAVKYACSIGNKYNAKVHAMHVVPDILDEYAAQVGIDLSSHTDDNKKEAYNKDRIEQAKTAVRTRMRSISKKILQEVPFCPLSKDRIIVKAGKPIDEIVATAKKDNFDLIIMGTHGHGDLEEIMLGSTANGVIQKSSVPVLIARPV